MNIRVKTLKSDSNIGLFRHWLEFLKPYHKMAPKEMRVVSILLEYRYQISLSVTDEGMIDRLLFAPETRKSIREDLGGMSNVGFNNLLFALRKREVLTSDNILLRTLIPPMGPSDTGFKLVFNFELNGNE